MKERIKTLRKHLGLTQQKFADRLGLKRQTIAAYEIGNIEPSDSTLLLICKEFNVNETWLRTGEGSMKAPLDPDDRFSINLSKLGRSENKFIQNAVNALAESDPEKLLIIEDFMRQCLGLKKEQD